MVRDKLNFSMRKLIAIAVSLLIVAGVVVIYSNVFYPISHRHSNAEADYSFELKYKMVEFKCLPIGKKENAEVEIKIYKIPA